jgi:carboxylate-amine ligase
VTLPARFGESARWSLGVEEELMLLDAASLEPAPLAEAVVANHDGSAAKDTLKLELFAAVLEINTPVCRTGEEALAALVAGRARTVELAAERDAVVAAFGGHPFSPSVEQAFSPDERYRSMIEFGGSVTRRQNVCGLHVHVGMPSAEACHRALEGALPWLPLVLALSANSPYVDGAPTGLLSNRAEVLALLFRNGAPPPFRSYEEWEAYCERLMHIGVIDGYTRLWWDIRPHPSYGTLEIRMPDQPTSVWRSASLAVLVQCLCAWAAEADPLPYEPGRRGDYVENRWRALRFGPRAELIHPRGDRLVAASDLLAELLELIEPKAARLGARELLGDLLPIGCEADLQLADGDAHAATKAVVQRSIASPA